MTIEAVRGKSTRASRRRLREELPIGEADANIFNCPACARPLGVGTSRCPGCATRLIGGVRASRAATFVGLGMIIGTMVGGVGVGLAAVVAQMGTTAIVEPGAVPRASGGPLASGQAPMVLPDVPASALSALRQSTLLNQRLSEDAAKLSAAVSAKRPSSVDIARSLRALAANAVFGDRIAPDVAAWPDAAVVSGDLVELYAKIGSTSRDGLTASVNNTRAYVASGKAMMKILKGLPALDAATRDLIKAAEEPVPALTIPS